MADEPIHREESSRFQALLSGLALGFPGVLLMVFGLPLSVCLPAGVVFGHSRLDVWGYLGLTCCTIFGSIFVYGACLLLGAATRALKQV